MKTAEKLVPELRFPGFEGEWNQKKLEEYLISHIERVPANTIIPVLTSSRKGLFRQEDYYANRRLNNKGEYGVVPKDYFTYRHMSDDSTFKFNINSKYTKGAVSKEYPVFTTKNIIDYFLFCKLNEGYELKRFAIKQKLGGTRVRLYFKNLIQCQINLPDLPEQQKIASFLSTVDKKIEKLTRKKELLEKYKKGVMQKIFSREIWFKDENGKDYPDWEEKRLGDVVRSIKSGKTKPLDSGKYPVYGSTGKIGYCDEITHVGQYVLIARVGANAGLINLVEGEFGVTDNTLVITKSEKVKNKFIYYLLKFFNLNRLVFGSGQPLVTGGQLKSLKLILATLPEQKKIANFLSTIDKKIKAVQTQLTQTQTFKKGLLQKMFV